MRRPLALTALLLATLLGACGGGGDSDQVAKTVKSETTEQPSPAQERKALEDTSLRPHIPQPTGSPPRRLLKEDIVKGKGAPAKPGDRLTLQYVGLTFSNGEEIDASWDRGQPYTFTLGRGRVIKGWNKGLVGMRKGGRRMLTIPPELAYGRDGSPPVIAPNETLVFVFDLIAIQRS